VNRLFKIFNIRHCSQFSFEDFKIEAIHLVKNYKWRINNERTVLNASENNCNSTVEKASCLDINSTIKKLNFNPNYEVMFRPMAETNHFNMIKPKVTKPQANILEEFKNIAPKQKENVIYNMKNFCAEKDDFVLLLKRNQFEVLNIEACSRLSSRQQKQYTTGCSKKIFDVS
jgi:hypothetical protein